MDDRIPLSWWPYRAGDATTSRRVLVYHEGLVLWHGPDIAEALGIDPVDLFDFPSHHLTGWEAEDGSDIPFYDTDTTRVIAGDNSRFHAFMQWVLGCLEAGARRPILLSPTPAAGNRPTADIVDIRADTFSVARAAHLISRDPIVDVGRDALFQLLRDNGWITKDIDTFIPTPSAVATGLLARNRIWNRDTKIAYNQVRITRAGLHELHRLLGGIVTLNLDAPTPAPLVEV